MKTKWVVGIVAAAHVAAIGSVMLMQGCGTVRGPAELGSVTDVTMPPTVLDDEVVSVPVEPAQLQIPEARSWPAETTTYIVAKGDSLSGIAARFGLSVAELSTLNDIRDPNRIRAGQPLLVTGKPMDATAKPVKEHVAASKPIAAPVGAFTHEVKKGESLSVIAAQYGIRTADLKKANGLTTDRILEGWKLVIPGAKKTGSSPSQTGAAASQADATKEPAFELEEKPAGATTQELNVEESLAPSLPSTAAAPVAQGAGQVRIHVVEEGEDLYGVAMMWGVSVARIRELNNLTDSTLKAGDRIKIPIAE